MSLHGPAERLEHSLAHEIVSLANKAGHIVGHTLLGEPEWFLRVSSGQGFVGAWAMDQSGKVTAYAQALRAAAEETWSAEVIVGPSAAGQLADLGAPLMSRLLAGVARQGGGHVHLWATATSPAHNELAARAGLEPHRSLHQMRRPLPIEETTALQSRPFVLGQDEAAVLAVNGRAFAAHPDQGHMTRAMLEARLGEAWFDPSGFLLSEIDGELAGFCWTKLFRDTDPVLGEIHIICVDPNFTGHGLGVGLVVAGLTHLYKVGAGEGMLFVEGNNDAALALYHRLGFAIVRSDRAFATTVAASTPTPGAD